MTINKSKVLKDKSPFNFRMTKERYAEMLNPPARKDFLNIYDNLVGRSATEKFATYTKMLIEKRRLSRKVELNKKFRHLKKYLK